MNAAVSPLPSYVSAEQRVLIRLTVEADSIDLVRQALIAACGESVKVLRTQTVPRSTQLQIWLVLADSAVPDAMRATLRAVPHGEIGPVFQQHHNLDNTQ